MSLAAENSRQARVVQIPGAHSVRFSKLSSMSGQQLLVELAEAHGRYYLQAWRKHELHTTRIPVYMESGIPESSAQLMFQSLVDKYCGEGFDEVSL